MVKQRRVAFIFFFLLVVFFLFFWLLKPAFSGQLKGTFSAKKIPPEYLVFKNFIEKQPEFFRILWVPKRQRFGFESTVHPALYAVDWLKANQCLPPLCELKMVEYDREYFGCPFNERCFLADASFLANPDVIGVLDELSVKYLVIPYDSEEEIFLKDHRYDHEQREKLEEFLDTIPWLKKIEMFGGITAYELVNN